MQETLDWVGIFALEKCENSRVWQVNAPLHRAVITGCTPKAAFLPLACPTSLQQ